MPLRIKPGGFAQVWGPYVVEEFHSSTCSHCQKITDFPTMRKMHDYVDVCRGCMKLICLECVGKPCITWLKKCDIEEEIDRRKFREL